MSEEQPDNFKLPESKSTDKSFVNGDQNIVVIGANGSGKSRLGEWIEFESPQKTKVHRVSAQKSLTMPENVQPTSVKRAERSLRYGRENIDPKELSSAKLIRKKRTRRWRDSPVTDSLSDFKDLLVYLFSEESDTSINFRRKAKNTNKKLSVPKTKLDKTKNIWETVFPHRKLKSDSGEIKAHPPDNPESAYNAKNMSDGERVALYHIGQCLAAPEGGCVVVDEPEMHLHKSIQSDLWDLIEQERSDCKFVYLTHNLDFATERDATRVWLKNYDGNNWDWHEISDQEGISEDVLLSIIGSRQPVLFVEGDRSSLDYRIYNKIYSGFTVIPCGGCKEVITATKAFEKINKIHELDCWGLVDKDYRTSEEVKKLNKISVKVTQVSEIENLLITEEVLRTFSKEKKFDESSDKNIDDLIHEAKHKVFEAMDDEKERLAASIAAHQIRRELDGFGPGEDNREGLKLKFRNVTDINVDVYYRNAEKKINEILEERNYAKAIEVFDQKNLLYEISKYFDEKGETYIKYIVRLLASGHEDITEAIQKYVPSIKN